MNKEYIAGLFLHVDEVLNTIIGHDESVVVQKVLRSLPLRFNEKIPTIKEIKYL